MGYKIRVAVVDDHPLFREGVVHALRAGEDFDVVGEGTTADEAVRLVADHDPDVLLLDMTLPGDGLRAVEAIVVSRARTSIIMLTVVGDQQSITKAMKAGARGYLLKGTGGHELMESIKVVARGDIYLTSQLIGMLIGHMSGREQKAEIVEFTKREEQILILLSRGMSNKQIAFHLSLSEKTVKFYLTHVLRKLNVQNRVAAALYASQRYIGTGGETDRAHAHDAHWP